MIKKSECHKVKELITLLKEITNTQTEALSKKKGSITAEIIRDAFDCYIISSNIIFHYENIQNPVKNSKEVCRMRFPFNFTQLILLPIDWREVPLYGAAALDPKYTNYFYSDNIDKHAD